MTKVSNKTYKIQKVERDILSQEVSCWVSSLVAAIRGPLKGTSVATRSCGRACAPHSHLDKIKRIGFFSMTIMGNLRLIEVYSKASWQWTRSLGCAWPQYYFHKQITWFINHIIFMLVKEPVYESRPGWYFVNGWTVVGATDSIFVTLVWRFSLARFIHNGREGHSRKPVLK